MACYGGLKGILSGLTKSTDHPSTSHSFRLSVDLEGVGKDLLGGASGRLRGILIITIVVVMIMLIIVIVIIILIFIVVISITVLQVLLLPLLLIFL